MSPTSTKLGVRIALALFAVLISMQAAWILVAEGYQLDHIRLPADENTTALINQENIKQAASLAVVRGDLWARTAFAYRSQFWVDGALELDAGDPRNTELLQALTQAVRYSPHRGDVWLMFAAFADRYKWPGYQPSLLLKMSYYTAPSELSLFPLRLNISLHAAGVIDDAELQDLIRRDISDVLTRTPALKPALRAAYKAALPEGKALAETVIKQLDPSYLGVLRTAYP